MRQIFRLLLLDIRRKVKEVMSSESHEPGQQHCSVLPPSALKRKLEDQEDETEKKARNTSPAPAREPREGFVRKPKARKFAMLLSYSGVGYYGMQINGDFPTIEKAVFSGLKELDVVESSQPQTFRFQRAARTDKGVSAVRQMCSLSLRITDEDLKTLHHRLNQLLPHNIRVMGFKRATKGFDSKKDCSSRTYTYTMPSYAFAHCHEVTEESFRMDESRLAEVNSILKIFEGTHNYFNFTSGKEHKEMSCNRYIIECRCEPPFSVQNLEFVTLRLKGQSFLLHQIRKMIGMSIAIIRGMTDKSTIQRAWESKRVDVPKAPGLGLLLEKVHYETYDERFGKDRELLDSWTQEEEAIEKHRKEWILPTIYEGESKEKSMMEWLATLPLHNYDLKDGEKRSPIAEAHKLIRDRNEEKTDSISKDSTVTTSEKVTEKGSAESSEEQPRDI